MKLETRNSKLLVGTSGYSYQDWRGRWYPPDITPGDMLEFYAGVFTALEINVTYYRTPGRSAAEGIVRRAAGRLVFAIKAPGDLTHRGDSSPAVMDPFRRFLEPFADEGTLGAVLLQFPASFHEGDASWQRLQEARQVLADFPLVAELRHQSWDTDTSDSQLVAAGYSRAIVDQPEAQVRGLSESGRVAGGSPIAYFRFHGRNAAAWYNGVEASSRYHYRYPEGELEQLAVTVRKAKQKAASTFAFFNNHPEGNAPRDAETFAEMLHEPLRGTGYRDLLGEWTMDNG